MQKKALIVVESVLAALFLCGAVQAFDVGAIIGAVMCVVGAFFMAGAVLQECRK